jgi:hypothetical protein
MLLKIQIYVQQNAKRMPVAKLFNFKNQLRFIHQQIMAINVFFKLMQCKEMEYLMLIATSNQQLD